MGPPLSCNPLQDVGDPAVSDTNGGAGALNTTFGLQCVRGTHKRFSEQAGVGNTHLPPLTILVGTAMGELYGRDNLARTVGDPLPGGGAGAQSGAQIN
jgi:hypothetical protein